MRLHDTASGAVTPLETHDGRVGIYVCGITPYDGGHIGHAFTYHTFDVVTRRLRSRGVEVRSVRNVTDVDDDILRVARARGVEYRALGDEQVSRFDRDMADLGLLAVDVEPRATAHVADMVVWIDRLVSAASAYCVGGWVYFDVASFPRYGSLCGLDAATMVALSRERGADPDDPRKRHPLDFVLWQPSAPGEPSWPSPWSDGRPGWHIECTVLATAELATPIDIHGGGDDLIFPHHESEIAQAEGVGVRPYVGHWVHVAMVRFQGEKMSKSLGNLVFVRDLLDRVPAATVRLMLAAHHYREGWEYTEDELSTATRRTASYVAATRQQHAVDEPATDALRARFLERIDDDLDTPACLALLDEAVHGWAESVTPATAGSRHSGRILGELLDLLGVRLPAA